MPITPQQAANSQRGIVQSTGLLNANQASFAVRLAQDTGLDPYVVAAWVHSEEPASSRAAPNGANNWLNIGATGSGNFGGGNAAWQDPVAAADMTAAWLKGTALPGFGAPSAGIRAILHTAGKDAGTQIKAIQQSGWAASGYPNLQSTYTTVSGSNSLASQIANAATSPLVAAGTAASSIPDVASAIADVWYAITRPALWKRVLYFVGGAVLLFWGLKELTGAHVPQAVKTAAAAA